MNQPLIGGICINLKARDTYQHGTGDMDVYVYVNVNVYVYVYASNYHYNYSYRYIFINTEGVPMGGAGVQIVETRIF